MDYEALKDAVLALPLEQRRTLRTTLSRSLGQFDEPPIALDVDAVCRTAEEITGGRIHGDRSRRNVEAKAAAIFRIWEEGHRVSSIANAIGIGRAVTYHYIKMAKAITATPGIDPELARIYAEMNKRITP